MSRPIPIVRSDESGPFGCCNTCTGRGSDDCEECIDAHLYELDEDAGNEEAERYALAVA